jgi:hypothetical protein
MFTFLSPPKGRMRGMNRKGGIRESRAGIWTGNRAWGLAVAVGAIFAIAAFAGPAGAAASGQIGEAWGKAGSAAGLFNDPGMLGVDPSDGSVYSGEEKDETHYRIQKFTSGGEFKASVEIPRFIKEEGQEDKLTTVHGIAVDPSLHRLYVLEGCRLEMPATGCEPFSPTFGARRILVFSTEPSGSTLEPATPATLPLPSGEEAIYNPQTIAVDPSNHDLVILGDDIKEHLLIQRISSTGVAGARYVDTGDELRPPGKEAESLAVGPDGTTYTMTGGPSRAGAQNTRAWQLPPSLASVEPVPGFAEAAKSEGWTTGLLTPKTSTFVGGPQLAVSPDGSTLYWKESIEQPEEPNDPGNVQVRGYSLTQNATKVLYGNGSNAKKRCLIQTPDAGIATTGENLVVFDYGPGEESTAFGNRVMTFGPGGTECRAPVAKFTINGKPEAEEVSVEKGTSVTFDSTPSELIGLTANEIDWEFGDGGEEKVTGSPPAKSVKHTFAGAGTYRVTLRMKLNQSETANFGDPLPVTRLIKVTGGGALDKLTVSKAGSGFGTVTSPVGISCGSDCEQEYEAGKEVTLTAKASTGSKFSSWSGSGCSGTSTCKVTMTEAKAVTATFDPFPKKKLTVQKAGSGSGTVTSAPSGIDCRNDCEQEFEEGKVVTLTALSIPGTNSKFAGWSGGCTGTENPCMVTMNEAKTVTATFTSSGTKKLEVQFLGNGTGRVASIPIGLNCTVTCSSNFDKDKEVELVEEETGSSEFVKWGGACSGSGSCKVTMSEDRVVTIEFTDPGPFKLSVAKIGSGAGTVTSSPAGISCPSTCEQTINKDEKVKLTATPGGNSEFVKWGGDCSGTATTCELTMSKARNATAEFKSTSLPQLKLKVKKIGTGSGEVTSSPAGIACGGVCEFEFEQGTEVELSGAASGGSEFVKWTGACTGGGTCKVTMSAAKEVTAEFKAKPKFRLTVIKSGSGSGRVTSSPAGIDCGGSCEMELEAGTTLELGQSADPGSEFIRWTGACTGNGVCKVTMSAPKTVTAEFKSVPKKEEPTPPPTPTPTPKPLTPRQKALKKCKKLKGKKRAKCIKKANSIGKKKHRLLRHERPKGHD